MDAHFVRQLLLSPVKVSYETPGCRRLRILDSVVHLAS